MAQSISVVIPALNAERYLDRCLGALHGGTVRPHETIVVDDGSVDGTRQLALNYGAIVLSTGKSMGPSFARNLGSKMATGKVLLFIDSDVLVAADTLEKFGNRFEKDASLDALIGAYDTEPYCWGFLSQYKNLMHSFVHQTGSKHASTFWSGCGAIRTEIFQEHGGFDETFERPAIEDIELGYRMVHANRKIALDGSIQVKHLKCWTLKSIIETDIFHRGIPWTRLILRDHFMPNDLNLRMGQRVSVFLVFVLLALGFRMAAVHGLPLMFPLFAIVFWMLARWWGELVFYSKPRRAHLLMAALLTGLAATAYFFKMYGLIVPLLLTPALLLVRHRYRKNDSIQDWHRLVALAYIAVSLGISIFYIRSSPLLYACVGVSAALIILNLRFYAFLFDNRGIAFMLSAILFNFLYHFYSGISFIIGITNHFWDLQSRKQSNQSSA
ncbi:glycosyltransferase involved in cell wall biosynthesis [Granulicella aggregans]|uniref:Glycosyltransferase involved in cell wall biosynthesis n=1 Tax=Granulicella aggregans TaxID=474949 RepID=A0A7W8E5G7_9BACT|nr:glycosyltransferase family 2 protein [Granulicella aggregans]MBB5059626.1 glycosyltransferase involved in cell wall biosynthesis [Granulicella aggregans]